MGEKFEIPKDLLYTKDHEWVKVEDGVLLLELPIMPKINWAT